MAEQVTKGALEKMQKKLEELKSRRKKISKTIGEARDHGDIRENSAYHSAKEEQGLNEMRIKDMEARLESAIVVSDAEMAKKDKVVLGAMVKLKNMDTGEEFEYTLVSEIDSDVLENKISTDSPLGAAIIKCKKGAVVKVNAPRGLIKYKILEIK
ncbi:MAG: transcription elongation factor GreA [Candidatus Saganbacteria bacterium]|nr:transcription elongation factor GreA [Candidatus Saganbacteria bacterium]